MGAGNFRPDPGSHGIEWLHRHVTVPSVPESYEDYEKRAFESFKTWVETTGAMPVVIGVDVSTASPEEWSKACRDFFKTLDSFAALNKGKLGVVCEEVVDQFADDEGFTFFHNQDDYYSNAQEEIDDDRREAFHDVVAGLPLVRKADKSDRRVSDQRVKGPAKIGQVEYVGKYNYIGFTGWESDVVVSIMPIDKISNELIWENDKHPDYIRLNALLARQQELSANVLKMDSPAKFMLVKKGFHDDNPSWERLNEIADQCKRAVELIESSALADDVVLTYVDRHGESKALTGREKVFYDCEVFTALMGETPDEFLDRNADLDADMLESILTFTDDFGETPEQVREGQRAEYYLLDEAVISALAETDKEIYEADSAWTSHKVDVRPYQMIEVYPLAKGQLERVMAEPETSRDGRIAGEVMRAYPNGLDNLAPLLMDQATFEDHAKAQMGTQLNEHLYQDASGAAWAVLAIPASDRRVQLALAKRCVDTGAYLPADSLPPYLARVDDSEGLAALADHLGVPNEVASNWTAAMTFAADGDFKTVYVTESSRPFEAACEFYPVLALGNKAPHAHSPQPKPDVITPADSPAP